MEIFGAKDNANTHRIQLQFHLFYYASLPAAAPHVATRWICLVCLPCALLFRGGLAQFPHNHTLHTTNMLFAARSLGPQSGFASIVVLSFEATELFRLHVNIQRGKAPVVPQRSPHLRNPFRPYLRLAPSKYRSGTVHKKKA